MTISLFLLSILTVLSVAYVLYIIRNVRAMSLRLEEREREYEDKTALDSNKRLDDINADDASIITTLTAANSNMARLDREKFVPYLLGYRASPLLRITPVMGGSNNRGIRDFIRFLLGDRGYIRLDIDEPA